MTVYCIGAQCNVRCSLDTECPLITSAHPTVASPTLAPTDATSNPTNQMIVNPTSEQSGDSSQLQTIAPTKASEVNEETTALTNVQLPNNNKIGYLGDESLDLMVVMSVAAILFVCSLCVLYYAIHRQKNNKKLTETEVMVKVMASGHDAQNDSKKEKDKGERLNVLGHRIKKRENVQLVAVEDEDDDESLYNFKNNDSGTDKGYTKQVKSVKDTYGNGEGFNGYERIERILKWIYHSNYEQYLMKFKNEMITDKILFEDDKFRAKFPQDDDFWARLIPQNGARFAFFERVNANSVINEAPMLPNTLSGDV